MSITQAGTLTAAAERLNLTKPAVSMALRELETTWVIRSLIAFVIACY
ncbi:MAG: LysR family transcriptional regulator [Candidatus Competibacteraceae bacterium]